MSNQITTQTLSFYGSDLITLKVEDVIYTTVKPIVEALGLSWGTQKRKLIAQQEKFNWVHMNSVAEDGKIREMLCMPIKKLNGWLFSINPDKVRSDLREKVIQYQEECFQALHDYWTKGIAINERKTTVDDRTGLRDAVNMLVSKKGLIYSEAYNLIHQYMNVQHIDEIPADKLPMAVAYCHKIVLEGELIDTLAIAHKSAVPAQFSEEELRDQAWLWKISWIMLEMIRTVEKPLSQLGSSYAGACCGMLSEYGRYIERVRAPLARETEHIQLTNFSTWEWNQVLPELRRGEVGQLWGSDKAVTRQFV
ncbi:phage antirepressor N-terminal domain-containing protein [Testudinibacter sp. TR-2022]|uniref:phage antirepressor N-terminal domain-containing protein n=1 Tax=Testudinibacter sp. TR-2022 TaxID=2585029 RepID=UPI0011189E1E|nr:phage antirepressor N-terminal domain-containing protein [Testudinibacter sp. TR-2022]TNH06644.1 phage antirepressor Ant [Pasteurellaceae bacterium Phil11]TNH25703.1 phage antirepressor Ant [Testudinibacter sp. TR-2022]